MAQRFMCNARRRATDAGYFVSLIQQLLNNF
jgi:hypothetical protein